MPTNYTPFYRFPYPQLLDPTPSWTEDQTEAILAIDALFKTVETSIDTHANNPAAHGNFREEFFVVDGEIAATKQLVLHQVPVSGSENVALNGLIQSEGISGEYTIEDNVITFTDGCILTVGDAIQVKYKA